MEIKSGFKNFLKPVKKPTENLKEATAKKAPSLPKGLKRKLKFTAPEERVKEAFQKSFIKVQASVHITGFRPGKAPKDILKQSQYYSDVVGKAADDLFNELYPQAVKDNQLNPTGDPKILDITLEEGKPCSFEVEVEVHPTVTVKNYLKLKVKKESIAVTQEQIDEALKKLQEKFKEYEDINDKTAELIKGLPGVFSMEARFKNDKQFKPLCLKEAFIQIGAHHIAPGFDTHITGMKIGEQRKFLFSFPKDIKDHRIAGEPLFFTVQLLQIKKEVICSLDKLAKILRVKDLTELQQSVKKEIHEDNEKKTKKKLNESIIDELVKQNPLPLPEALVKRERKSISDTMKEKLKTYKATEEEMKQFFKEHQNNIEETAKKNVHAAYLLEALTKDLEVKVEEEELEPYLDDLFPSINQQEKKRQLKNKTFKNNLIYQASIDKLLLYLIDQADIL